MLCFRFEMSITGKSAETGPVIASEVANAALAKRARSRFMPEPPSRHLDIRPGDPARRGSGRGPVELPLTEPGRREALTTDSRLNGLQPLQVLGLADAGKGQCHLPEAELEEPIAVSRLEIVVEIGT